MLMADEATVGADLASVNVIVATSVGKSIDGAGGVLTILEDVNLSIAEGETVAIVGRSGSGKTTLLSLLAGLDLPSSGRIELTGHDIGAMDEDARAAVRAGGVGFVFQSFQLLAGFTALENVMLPAELAGLDRPAERARAALQQVGLEHRLNHYPTQLSGGEQQRVAIARATAARPDLIFADEPTGNLDVATGHEIVELLFARRAETGATLLVITHDPELADHCERVLQLADGRIASDTAA